VYSACDRCSKALLDGRPTQPSAEWKMFAHVCPHTSALHQLSQRVTLGPSHFQILRKIGKKSEIFAILSIVPENQEPSRVYRLGNFYLDPEKQLLLAQGQPVHLSRKPYELLLYLVANRHRMVPRNELLERFWGGKDVYDQTLSKAVSAIRKALGEPREAELFIETRWSAGYRYIGPFKELPAASPQQPFPEIPKTQELVQVGSSPNGVPTSWPSAEPQRVPAYSNSTQGPGLRWAVVLVLLLCVSGLAVWGRRSLTSSATSTNASSRTSPPPVRPCVAVFVFKNLSQRADEDWFGGALAEMLSTELGADGRLRALPGETIARATTELHLATQSGLAPETLAAVRKNLAADYVVTGAYAVVYSGHDPSSHQLRLDICVQDTKSGETIATFANAANVPQLFSVAATTGTQMIQSLRLPGISPGTEELARAALPSDPTATRLYMQGLQKLRQQDLLTARDTLVKAVQADPSFPLAHLALADAWQNLGYLQNEKLEASKAFDLSSHLSRELQLYVRARYLHTTRDWDQTIKTYHTLMNLYPDNIEYGLQLAETQTAADRPREAQATIEALHKIASPAAQDPRLDLAEAVAARALSDFQNSARAAARAAEKARAQHAPLLYARALSLQAAAIADIDPNQAIRLSEEALGICQRFQDLGCLSSVHRRLGNFQIDSDPDGAEANFHEALRLARQLGNLNEEGNALNSIAVLLSNHGRLMEARAVYQELLDRMRDNYSPWGTQMVLNNLGGLEIREGKLSEALANEEKALVIATQIGLQAGAGDELLDIAEIMELQGDLAAAQAKDQEALRLFTSINSTEGRAIAHAGLGNISRDRGDLAAARDHYQQSIELLATRGDSSELADSRLALARVTQDQGRSSDAVSLARSAVDLFQKLRRPADEASARAFLATALAERGDLPAAKLQAEESIRLIRGSESLLNQLEVGIFLARANVLTSNTPSSAEVLSSVRQLRDLSARARNAKMFSLQLQADLASAEAQAHSGHSLASQASLETLERNASRTGFLLIARQANALRSLSAAQLHAPCCSPQ
jgi:eukaryotic-like serine/threonine-protein kinase